MNNRDYYTRPVQSDRTSYGYGHTDLDNEPHVQGHWTRRFEYALTRLLVAATVFAGVCLWARS